MIRPDDEWLHPPGGDPAWQESFYFNWADPERRTFGLARIGYRPNVGKTDGLVVSVRDGKLELFYAPADIDHDGPCSAEDPAAGMRAEDLLVAMEEPLHRWRIQIGGHREMDLVFEAHTPAFDHHASRADGEPRRLAATMTEFHFEQSGSVTGWTHFQRERHEIRAFGQRGKSWGVRDWSHLEGWNWISGQFGADLSFNIMQTFENGRALDNGFVFRDGENHAIDTVSLQLRWAHQEHLLRDAQMAVIDVTGRRYDIRAEALASVPILRKDVWLEETHVAFTLESDGGAREGQGVVEHVWRPSPDQIQRRAARVASILPALRR
jgi:hypothetical protein